MTLAPVLLGAKTPKPREVRSPVILALALLGLLTGLIGGLSNLLDAVRLIGMQAAATASADVWERVSAVCGVAAFALVAMASADSLLGRASSHVSLTASALGAVTIWFISMVGNLFWEYPERVNSVISPSALMGNPIVNAFIGRLVFDTLLTWGWVAVVAKGLAAHSRRAEPAEESPIGTLLAQPVAPEAARESNAGALEYQALAAARRAAAPLDSVVAGRALARALCWFSLIFAVLSGIRYAETTYDRFRRGSTTQMGAPLSSQALVASSLFENDRGRMDRTLFAPAMTLACVTIAIGATLALVGGPGGRATLLAGLLLFSVGTLFYLCLDAMPNLLLIASQAYMNTGSYVSHTRLLEPCLEIVTNFLRNLILPILCLIGLRDRSGS